MKRYSVTRFRIIAGLLVPAFLLCTTRAQAASTIQFTTTSCTVAEGAGTVTLSIQRTNDVDALVTVDYATTDGTATNGLKYTAVSGTLQFAAGVTNQPIVVPILNEPFIEGSKYFRVFLTNASEGAVLGTRTTTTVNITDNDVGLQVEFSTYQACENEVFVLIGVLRGDDGDFPVTVDFATADSTALAGQDYTVTNGMLGFAAGERLKLVTIPILNDGLKEPNKTFRFYLTNATGVVLGSPKTATITIVDNDPGVQFDYNKYWIRENEGLLTVKVVRGNDVDLPPFSVDYATSNLTAVAGEDYTDTKGTLTFAQGETFKMLNVPILCNQTSKSDRQFKLTLSNPSAGVVLGTSTEATNVVLDVTGMTAHRFDRIAVLPDRVVQLTLGGAVHARFRDYFDLYPIEVSTNLVDWIPLVTLQRTNSLTNVLTYVDSEAVASNQRFYRTAATNLITPMLQPSGPRPIGLVNRWVADPARRNRFGNSTNGAFAVMIWYPAAPQAGKLPVSPRDSPLLQDAALLGSYLDRVPYFVSHAVSEAPCAMEGGPYPIVLFSHGYEAGRVQPAEKAENLASHGFILVAMDHYDSWGALLPDGTLWLPATSAPMTEAGLQDRVRDLAFVLDELTKWNEHDPLFAGRLDVNRVAAMGFSWGGPVAAEFCRVDPRCRAAIPLDPGGNSGALMTMGLQEPLLQINRSDNSDYTLFGKAAKDACWFQISSTQHLNFDDSYWWSFPDNLAAARQAARTVNAYTLWFLNKYLKGSTDPMPVLANYPRIINFKQK